MNKDEIAKANDAICTIKLYIELATSYIDNHEEIDNLAPLVMALDKMEKETNLLDEIFQNCSLTKSI